MILPYYRIEKTEDGKQFFFANRGYFNFWDEYLIMNIGEERNKTYPVLVNRTDRKFNKAKVAAYHAANVMLNIKNSVCARRPEEMFDDFPELKKFDYLKVNKE